MTQPPIDFPWDEANILKMCQNVHTTATALLEATAIEHPDFDEKVHTLTYEEAVLTVQVATGHIANTITNSFTSIALGMNPEEQE